MSHSIVNYLNLKKEEREEIDTENYSHSLRSWYKILVNNLLDPQLSFRICLFQFSTCFDHTCTHHQEIQLY
jgi:hypothetical protein